MTVMSRRRAMFAVLPFLLVAPYGLYMVRGGMPTHLARYILETLTLLCAATLLLSHPRARDAIDRHFRLVLVAGGIAYFVAACALGHLWNPTATAPEMFNFHQEYLDALRGGFFTHPTENRSEFAIHFSPVLLLGLPAFAIFPKPITLFALGSLALTIALLPALRFMRLRWDRPEAALLAFGAVLYPSILALHVDFSPVRLAPFAVWLALTAYRRRSVGWLAVSFLACWMVKETLSLALIMVSVIALIERRPLSWVLIPGASAIAVFLMTNQWIIPWFAGTAGKTSTIAAQFGYWGSNAPEVIGGFLRDPASVFSALFRLNNLAYLLKLGHPTLFVLPLGSPIILAAVPEALVNMIAGFNPALLDPARPGPWTSLLGHYSATVGTVLWAAATESFAPRRESDDARRDPEAAWTRARVLFLAVLSSVIYPTNAESL